jgi:hypothetical protein
MNDFKGSMVLVRMASTSSSPNTTQPPRPKRCQSPRSPCHQPPLEGTPSPATSSSVIPSMRPLLRRSVIQGQHPTSTPLAEGHFQPEGVSRYGGEGRSPWAQRRAEILPRAGIEPARPFELRILSPVCLPIPSPRRLTGTTGVVLVNRPAKASSEGGQCRLVILQKTCSYLNHTNTFFSSSRLASGLIKRKIIDQANATDGRRYKRAQTVIGAPVR